MKQLGSDVDTQGKLIALSKTEIVIEVNSGDEAKSVRVHFPRLGYGIKSPSSGAKL